MSKVEKIIARAKSGCKIRFYQGHFGNEWVVVKGGWLLPTRSRYELSGEEIRSLKKSLRQLKMSRRPVDSRTAA